MTIHDLIFYTHTVVFLSARVKDSDATIVIQNPFLYGRSLKLYSCFVCVHFQGPSDKCVIEGNDCTIVSDLSKITLQQNTDTLGELSSWIVFIIHTNLMKDSTFSPLVQMARFCNAFVMHSSFSEC